MCMIIREAKKEDYDSCIEIAKDLSEWFDAKEIEEISNNLLIYPTFVLEEERVQAFAILQNKSDDTVEIKHFAVARNRQHRGLGTKLIRYIEEEYKGKDYIEVKTLDASADYAPYVYTRAFYVKNGFVKTEVIDSYPGWEPGNPCAVYVKKILSQ